MKGEYRWTRETPAPEIPVPSVQLDYECCDTKESFLFIVSFYILYTRVSTVCPMFGRLVNSIVFEVKDFSRIALEGSEGLDTT